MSQKAQPELKLNTSLASLSKFIKAAVLALTLLGVGAGGTAGYNRLTTSKEETANHCSLEIQKTLNEYNSRLTKVETRMDNTDVNIIEIKASLVRIETFLINRSTR